MPVPKKKTSRSVRDQRRSHDAIKYVAAVEYCPSCGEPKLRHHACAKCGQYRGRAVGPNTIVAPAADGPEAAPPTE
jgi:large subunit ribosomal protein L32